MKPCCTNCAFFRANDKALSYLPLKVLRPLGICILHAKIVATDESNEKAEDLGCNYWKCNKP